MYRNKFLKFSLALLLVGQLSVPAFATTQTVANGTVVIGNKSFDLAYANNATYAADVSNAIVGGGSVYIKDFSGNWIDNITGKTVDVSIIPTIESVTTSTATTVSTTYDTSLDTTPVDNSIPTPTYGTGIVGTAAGDDGTVRIISIFDAAHDWGLNSPYLPGIPANRFTATTTPMVQYVTFGPHISATLVAAINKGSKSIYVTTDDAGKDKISVNIKAVNGKSSSVFVQTSDVTTIVVNGDFKANLITNHIYSVFIKLENGKLTHYYFQAM